MCCVYALQQDLQSSQPRDALLSEPPHNVATAPKACKQPNAYLIALTVGTYLQASQPKMHMRLHGAKSGDLLRLPEAWNTLECLYDDSRYKGIQLEGQNKKALNTRERFLLKLKGSLCPQSLIPSGWISSQGQRGQTFLPSFLLGFLQKYFCCFILVKLKF